MSLRPSPLAMEPPTLDDAMTTAGALAGVFISTLVVSASATAGSDQAGSSPRLTRDVPGFVQRVCVSARPTAPIPIVCPPLVPVTKYRTFTGLSGALLGNSGPVPVMPPRDRFYLLGFNGGDSGPTYWHWMAGMGTPEAIQYWVLSDARNVVRGKPKRVRAVVLDGRRVDIWRFPEHPAGGGFGGHYAAITSSGPLRAIASIHGDNAEGSARMAVALAAKAATASSTGGRSLRRFDRNGISFQYPRSWFVTTEPLSNGVDPTYRFTVSTHPVRRTADDLGPCLPGIGRQLPDDAVLAYVREALSGRATSLARMQRRPRSFHLTQVDQGLCGFPRGRWIPFKSGGRAFYLGLYVGKRAPQARAEALARLVDGMRIEPRVSP